MGDWGDFTSDVPAIRELVRDLAMLDEETPAEFVAQALALKARAQALLAKSQETSPEIRVSTRKDSLR